MKADDQNTTISCGINISYGLTIAGINGDYDTYLNKYTSKELQTGEFDPMVSTGLEMLDYSQSHLFFEGAHEIASLSFGSRFYDPQLGRWFTPDPAEQFANPYLAMGTTKREESFRWKDLASGELVGATVMYVDPDGEFILAALGIGFAMGLISGYSAGIAQGASGQDLLGYTLLGGTIGGATAIMGSVAGAGVATSFASSASLGTVGATSGAVGGFTGGSLAGMGNSLLNGADFNQSLKNGGISGLISAGMGAGIGAVSGAINQSKLDRQNSDFNSIELDLTVSKDGSLGTSLSNPTTGNPEQDFEQLLKAYRRVKEVHRENISNFKIQDVFDVESIKHCPYWKANGFYKDLYSRDLVINGELVKTSISISNQMITDVRSISNSRLAQITLDHFNGHTQTSLSSMTFINKSYDLFQRSWQHVYWNESYNLMGPIQKRIK